MLNPRKVQGNSLYNLTKYRHASVFTLADSTLEGIWTHKQKKKGWMRDKEVKRQMLEGGNCLTNFHARDVIHGDLCAKKIVRMLGRLTLMGLDKCSTIPSNYVGYSTLRSALFPRRCLPCWTGTSRRSTSSTSRC